MKTAARHNGYDNVKGLLIFCVVFGHFLELCSSTPLKNCLYLLIYSFHMPAFLFFSGLFATYDTQRMRQYLILYWIFQILYRLMACCILRIPSALTLQSVLCIPYWLLWYLPVMLYCQLLIPLWSRVPHYGKAFLLALSISAALLCGYCDWIGYTFSLSRFLVFLPFFLFGQAVRCCQQQIDRYIKRYHFLPILAVSVLLLSLYVSKSGHFTAEMMYGSYPYSIGYRPVIRLQLMLIATVWIVFLYVLANTVFNNAVPILTYIGKNTLPIYLFHGFAVKLAKMFFTPSTVFFALVCSAACIAMFGNPLCARSFHPNQQNKRFKQVYLRKK